MTEPPLAPAALPDAPGAPPADDVTPADGDVNAPGPGGDAHGEPAAHTTPASDTAGAAHDLPRSGRTPALRRLVAGLLLVWLLTATGASIYLWRASDAWQQRSEQYLDTSRGLGADLAETRSELAGVQSELDAVRTQLATAQERIVELADEKAQLGDDREVQRQLADYQERITDAAGRVALALDQCVQGQNQLIGYMENAAQYDPAELDQYAASVQALCQTATEANTALQSELAR